MEISIGENGAPIGGTFQLGFRGDVTRRINATGDADIIEKELELLETIGDVDVTKSITGTKHSWLVRFMDHIGTLPALEFVNTTDLLGLHFVDILFQSAAKNVEGSFTLSFTTEEGVTATTAPIAHNASAQEVKRKLEAINDMAAGIVDVVRVGPDHNYLYQWKVNFTTMRGNLNALVPNTEGITNYIAGSTDLAFGPLPGTKVQKFPYMLVRELVSGTRVGGNISISLPSITPQLANADPKIAGVQNVSSAVTKVVAEYYLSKELSVPTDVSVTMYGPDKHGGYMWRVKIKMPDTLKMLEPFDKFEVSANQLDCNSGQSSSLCNPTVVVHEEQKGMLPEIQSIEIYHKHQKKIQQVVVAARAFQNEVQQIKLSGTSIIEGHFSVGYKFGSTGLLAVTADGPALENQLRKLEGLSNVEVSLESNAKTVKTWFVTFTGNAGNVPSLWINDTYLLQLASILRY